MLLADGHPDKAQAVGTEIGGVVTPPSVDEHWRHVALPAQVCPPLPSPLKSVPRVLVDNDVNWAALAETFAKERDWFARRRAVSRRGSAVRRPLRPSAARHRIRGPRRGQAHARHGRWPGRVRRQGQVAVVAAGGRDGDGHRQTRSDGRLTAKAGSRPASCSSVDSRGLDEPCRSTAGCRARRSRRAPARPGRLRREARGSVGSSPCLRWR